MLERAIGDPHRLVGRKVLCHGGEMRLVRRALCHLDGSGIKEGARSLEPRFHVGKGEPGRLEIRDGLAELRSEESREGKSVSVRVDLGGRRIIKIKKSHQQELERLRK